MRALRWLGPAVLIAAIPIARAQLAPAPTTTAAAPAATTAATDRCYACHLDIESPQAQVYARDVHAKRGVGCADCHGGDPTSDDQDAGMSKAHGYLGKLRKSDIPKVCGKCHGPGENAFQQRYRLTNVVDSLAAGAHGEALRASDKGPQCVSCHGVHDIAAVDDPRSPVHPLAVAKTCGKCHSDASYMRAFNPRLPVDQYAKYLTSQHGQLNAKGDPKPATCVSCHSNHLIDKVKDPRSPVYATRIPETCSGCHSDAKYMKEYKIPTDQMSEYRKSAHGVQLLEKSDLNAPACNSCHGNHAAIPPEPSAIVAVCGNCHQSNAELFEKSSHRDAFAKKKLSGCVVCHGNHGIRPPTDALIAMDDRAPCAKCHSNAVADSSVASLHRIRSLLDSLSLGKRDVERLLGNAEQLGMDVSDAAYELKGAHQALVQSRVAVHSFRVADIEAAARPGLDVLQSVRQSGQAAVYEYHFRRRGLAVSTLIVTVLALLIYLKIRQLEKGEAKS